MKRQILPLFFILCGLNAGPPCSGADEPIVKITATPTIAPRSSGGDHRCFKTYNPRNFKDLNCLSPEQMAAQVLATFMQQTPPPTFAWRNPLKKIDE